MTFRLLGSYQKRPVIGCALSYRVGQSFQPQGTERALPPGVCVCIVVVVVIIIIITVSAAPYIYFSESGAHKGLGDGVWRMEGI